MENKNEIELSKTVKCAVYLAEEFKVNDNKAVTPAQQHILQGYADSIARCIDNFKPSKDNKELKWSNIDYSKLRKAVYVNAHLGLDMWQENMLSIVPFYNKTTQKYELSLMRGYNGIKYLAEKYSKDKIVNITTELIYEKDKFVAVKKDINNEKESYIFEVTDIFNRGAVVGGFGYIEYEDSRRNKLILMTRAEMDKRKPKYASAEFWGGDKPIYENRQKTDKVEHIEGWKDEMYLKTLIRYVCNQRNIPLDPAKIGDLFVEAERLELEVKERLDSMEQEEPQEQEIIAETVFPIEQQEQEQIYIPDEVGEVQEVEEITEPQEKPQEEPKKRNWEDL